MKKMIKAAAAVAAAVILTAAPVTAAVIRADEKPADAPAAKSAMSSIGSVSKTFGAAAAMQLVDEGKLELDAPVTDYLPDFRMADSRYKDITIRMLLSHSSGLMGTTGEGFMLFDDSDYVPHDNLLRLLGTQKLKADPGEFAAYCNDGFSLLELVIEEVSGESFSDYIRNHICAPLGLERTDTALGSAFRSPSQVQIFSDGVRLKPDYCMASASGGVISTASELSRFGKAFFTGNTELLSEKAKNEMKKKNIDREYEDGYGLGWDTVGSSDYDKAGVQVVEKGGDLLYQHASLVVAPDEKISVSVLSSGGNSAADQLLAKALLDVALEEKGIKVEHPEPEQKETLSEVPESYLGYEGEYLSASEVYRITFPDRKYMRVENLSAENTTVDSYMYTTEDSFVLMDGDVEKDKAVQAKAQTVLRFTERGGKDFIVYDQFYDAGELGWFPMNGYMYQRADEYSVSDKVQKAWEERNGRKYYVCSEKYSSLAYIEYPVMKVRTLSEAPGYTSLGRMADEDHLTYNAAFPGTRDLEEYTVFTDCEGEKLKWDISNVSFISEENIPVLEADTKEVSLRTKKASWYSIGESLSGVTVTLDIPENAAVYIFDSFDRLHYSSMMEDYGNRVTLPENGKIVFIGEDGGKITLS